MKPASHNSENPDGHSDQTFDQLVASHQQRLYYFIRAMIYSPDDARDTLQDVNIIIYRKQSSYEMGTNFKAWAFAIARFECLSYLSRYKKVQMTTLDSDLLETLADKAEEKADDIEPVLAALRVCVQSLNNEQRYIIQHRYHERTSLETVATQLQTSVGAVKQKLFRLRKQLKDCMLRRARR
ncbi:MAG: sigma-70 family RNA polymerase sigma factor [Akkermansiaceae bacterium]